MHAVLYWLGNVTAGNALIYWAALILVEVVLRKILSVVDLAEGKRKRLISEFWLLLGAGVPVAWIATKTFYVVQASDVVIAFGMWACYGVVFPVWWGHSLWPSDQSD